MSGSGQILRLRYCMPDGFLQGLQSGRIRQKRRIGTRENRQKKQMAAEGNAS